MSKKLIVLALAAVSAVMVALPAVAAAGQWEISTPEKFTATGGKAQLTVKKIEESESISEVECSENAATGKYTTKTTGEGLVITFKKCVLAGVANSNCESGSTFQTIVTTSMTFHNVMLETTANGGNIGILITPNESHFTTITCYAFGIDVATVAVAGNGVIGEVEKKCGEKAKTAGLTFTSSATGVQTWMQTTTEGTKFDLTATQGGKARTASEDATTTISFENEQTITCP